MSIRAIRVLLTDPMRPGSPEPALLPWLTARVTETDLPLMAAAAAAWRERTVGWPVVADGVADVLARRVRDPAVITAAVAALPPVAGRLGDVLLRRVDWAQVSSEELGYAALADGRLLAEALRRATSRALRTVLAAAAAGEPVPPLADLESLAQLMSDDWPPPSGDQLVYLLPAWRQLAPSSPPVAPAAVVATIISGVERDAWYAAALLTRAAPYLDDDHRAELREVADRLPGPWARHLMRLLTRSSRPWRSPANELAASHPATVELTELAPGVDPSELAALCRETAALIHARAPLRSPERDGVQIRQHSAPDHEDEKAGRNQPGRRRRDHQDRAGDAQTRRPRGKRGKRGNRERRSANHPNDSLFQADHAARRVVSTGLATRDMPCVPWDGSTCASPDTDYFYWFAVSPTPLPGAVDDRAEPLHLPPDAGPGTILTVALFSFPGEMGIVPGADVGELIVRGDGSVAVHRQPGTVRGTQKLFFPVRTPARPGRYRLRCNLYCRQTLLQSRLIQVDVHPGALRRAGAVRSTTDYIVDSALDPAALADIEPLTLSVFMNDNGNGTHGFRFFGDGGGIKADTVLREGALQNAIELARNALAKAAWGKPEKWREGFTFRYDGRREAGLADDLINLAKTGRQMWVAIGGGLAARLGAGPDRRKAPITLLEERLRAPGTVEFASKQDAGLVVPVSLFYDYLLDTQGALSICSTAMRAIDSGVDLVSEPCFHGRCPEQADPSRRGRVVCPSGFWGFRHRIGLPQSVHPQSDAPRPAEPVSSGNRTITYSGRPRCVVGIAAEFDGLHPSAVCSRGNESSRVYADRDELLAALRPGSDPHLVYFYCHGDISPAGIPGLMVGRDDSPAITFSEIAGGDMYWPESRPLVVLNGCRTAAVEPRYAMNLVEAFITGAQASGVIGTEVTTYERLAARFADVMLEAFFAPAVPLAEAMRRARLALLAEGNPLGLIYVAYAAPQLQLLEKGPSSTP